MTLPGLSEVIGSRGRHDFEITVDPFEIDKLMNHVMQAVSGPSLTEFLATTASDYYRDDIEARFYDEGDVKSGFWPDLKDATVAIRESLGFPGEHPINRRTDALYDYVIGPYQVTSGGDWAELEIPGGTPDPLTQKKLDTAQLGSKGGPRPSSFGPSDVNFGDTPPRPVLAVGDMDISRLLELLERHIIDATVGGVIAAAI